MKISHIASLILSFTAPCMFSQARAQEQPADSSSPLPTISDAAGEAGPEHKGHGSHGSDHTREAESHHEHAEGEESQEGHGHDHGDGAHHEHEEEQPVIVAADARARDLVNMDVETVPDFTEILVHSLYGYLSAPKHAMQTYAAPCNGKITLHVKSAQSVAKGDLLYTLMSPAITELQAEMTRTNATIQRCKTETETLEARVKELVDAGTRNRDLEVLLANKKAELAQHQQESSAAQSRLSMLCMGGTLVKQGELYVLEVRAESDGIVRNVGITQGSWREQGAPVMTMSNVQAMEIATSLFGSSLPHFSTIRGTIPTESEHVAVTGTWRLSDEVDAATHTRELFFTPDSLPDGVQPGQLCRLDFYAEGDAEGMVSIPDTAVVKVGVDDVVFVEVAEGSFAMVKVYASESRRGMTSVAGLSPGQRIVVRGGYELKYLIPSDGQQKKAGHFHADGVFHEGEEH